MANLFKDYKYPEVIKLAKKNALVIIPLAILEEHADHLPISTDYDIAENVAIAISEKLNKKIPHFVTPTIWTGYAPNYLFDRFPVFASIKLKTLIHLLEDIVESFIKMGFKKIILINGHGGNSSALPIVSRYVQDKYRIFIASIPLVYAMADKEFVKKIRKSEVGGIGHAGEFETALELYFEKNVDMSKATNVDKMKYNSKFVCGDPYGSGSKVIWSTWAYNKTITGALGDSSVASKETGKKIFKNIVDNCVEFILEFYKHRMS